LPDWSGSPAAVENHHRVVVRVPAEVVAEAPLPAHVPLLGHLGAELLDDLDRLGHARRAKRVPAARRGC